MPNITVTVSERTYRRARVRAAELDTSVSAVVARSTSSFRTMYRKRWACSSWTRARAIRSSISPVLSVARPRSLRSSSGTSAAMKIVMLPGTSSWTRSAPSSSSSRTHVFPSSASRSSSERSVP